MTDVSTRLPPQVESLLRALISALNLPSRQDVARLEAKLDELERLLEEIEAKAEGLEGAGGETGAGG